jgi:hypothetical protein
MLCYTPPTMVLFLLVSLPLLFSLVILLPWGHRQAPRTVALVVTFLKGVLIFFPAYLVVLLCRRIFGFSFDGFLLFLSLLLRDHLVPVLAALGGFLLLQKKLDFPATDEGIFLTVFSFLAGFFSMMNIADAVRTWGVGEVESFFLLPFIRMGATLLLSLAAQRFFRWQGRDGANWCAAGAGLSCLLTLGSFFFYSGRLTWAILLTAAPFLVGVVLFALRFPRTVRG